MPLQNVSEGNQVPYVHSFHPTIQAQGSAGSFPVEVVFLVRELDFFSFF